MAIKPWSSDLDLTPSQRRTPPVNTGRVRIGSRYEPVFRWEPSRDAYDLQTALLEGTHPGDYSSKLVRIRTWLVTILFGRGA